MCSIAVFTMYRKEHLKRMEISMGKISLQLAEIDAREADGFCIACAKNRLFMMEAKDGDLITWVDLYDGYWYDRYKYTVKDGRKVIIQDISVEDSEKTKRIDDPFKGTKFERKPKLNT